MISESNNRKSHFLESMITSASNIPDDRIINKYGNPCFLNDELRSLSGDWIKIESKYYLYKSIKNLNEFIGEMIANKLKLETAHYEPAYRNGRLMVRTPSYRLYDYDYYNLYDLLGDENISHDGINILKNKFNIAPEEIDKILKLFALDIYMRQYDRSGVNIEFKKCRYNDKISLAPIFDYSDSFVKPYDRYPNSILDMEIKKEEVYNKLYNYPDFFEYLKQVEDIDMLKLLKTFVSKYNLKLPEEVKDYYEQEDEYSKILIRKIR